MSDCDDEERGREIIQRAATEQLPYELDDSERLTRSCPSCGINLTSSVAKLRELEAFFCDCGGKRPVSFIRKKPAV